MGLVEIVLLVLMVFGFQLNFISCEEDSIKNVTIRCYVNGQITEYFEYALSDASIENLKLNASSPTVFYVHGWTQNVDESPTVLKIVNSFLQLNKHNVCVLNYKDLAKALYPVVVNNVPLLSEEVAYVLENWIANGVNPKSVHLIGFSIGAHICGLIGRRLGGIIGRISGLDPANPPYCASGIPLKDALKRGDAEFVDVIHTDGRMLGCMLKLGNADFYVNGGTRPQPMCGNAVMQYANLFLDDHCPHNCAVVYFANTVPANSTVYSATSRLNKKLTIPMGYHCPPSAKGSYDSVIN